MSSQLVTAVIPAHGRPERTQRAIDSVAEQTHAPIELFVVDDGTVPPLSEDLDLPDDKLEDGSLIRLEENSGANVARNAGIEQAHGEFIAFLDSDDEWHPEKIERQLAALENSGAQASYTSVRQLDANENLNSIGRAEHNGNLRNELLTGNKIGTFSSVMVGSDAINKTGTPDPDLPCWQDWEWYLRLSESLEFTAVDEPLVDRHNDGDQISQSFAPKREEAYPIIRDRLLDVAKSPGEKQNAIGNLDHHLGYAALVNGDYATARRLFLRSLLKCPRNVDTIKYLAVSGGHYPVARKLKQIAVRQVTSWV